MGLIGFDRVTRSTKSDWNLGYRVRSLNQKYGVARRSIRAVLEWLGRGNKIVVELKVDPHNLPDYPQSSMQCGNGVARESLMVTLQSQ